jgi:hypothetical protein
MTARDQSRGNWRGSNLHIICRTFSRNSSAHFSRSCRNSLVMVIPSRLRAEFLNLARQEIPLAKGLTGPRKPWSNGSWLIVSRMGTLWCDRKVRDQSAELIWLELKEQIKYLCAAQIDPEAGQNEQKPWLGFGGRARSIGSRPAAACWCRDLRNHRDSIDLVNHWLQEPHLRHKPVRAMQALSPCEN